MSTAFTTCIVALLVSHAVPALGRAQDAYKPDSTPRYLKGVNRYRMYHVHASDTTGDRVTDVAAEARSWQADGTGLRGVIEKHSVGWNRSITCDTFLIAPNGRVASINGAAQSRGRMDLLLHLPVTPLRPGLTWSDTVEFAGVTPPRGQHYRVERSYTVRRIFDSLGDQYAQVDAKGTVAYRDAYWADSASGSVTWIDLRGPVRESFSFNRTRGAMVYRAWDMDLRGQGSRAGAKDTVPAGLFSTDTLREVSEAAYRVITRDLPVGDTSYTVTTGLIFVHIAAATRDSIHAAMLRADGLVGTARARFVRGKPSRFESVWTGASDTVSRHVISVERDSIREHGMRTTTHSPPAGLWAIADHGMPEFVIPVLLEMPRDGGETAVTIYRPVAGKWTMHAAWVRPLGEHFLAALREDGDTDATYLIFDAFGRLMYGENSGPRGANRVLRPGTPRREEADQLIASLKASP